MYCIAESKVYAYTDHPYLVTPVYMPCSRGPYKVKPANGHSNTPYLHLETIKTTRKHFLVFEVHQDESYAIQQDPMGYDLYYLLTLIAYTCLFGPIMSLVTRISTEGRCKVERSIS